MLPTSSFQAQSSWQQGKLKPISTALQREHKIPSYIKERCPGGEESKQWVGSGYLPASTPDQMYNLKKATLPQKYSGVTYPK